MLARQQSILDTARKLMRAEHEFGTLVKDLPVVADHSAFVNIIVKLIYIGKECVELEHQLRAELSQVNHLLVVDKMTRKFIDDLMAGEDLQSTIAYRKMLHVLRRDEDAHIPTAWTDLINHGEAWDELNSSMDAASWYERRCAIGVILPPMPPPAAYSRYFEELRSAYALGHFMAAVALCRALVEMSLYDRLEAARALPPSGVANQKSGKDRIQFARLLKTAKETGLLEQENERLANMIVDRAAEVLHVRDRIKGEPHDLSDELARSTIVATLKFVNALLQR